MITLTVTIMLMTLVAACGSDGGDLPPPPASSSSETPGTPSPSLDLTPAEQQAVDEARAKFDEFMNAYIEVSTAPLPTADTAEDLFFRVDEHLGGLLSQELRGEIVARWAEQRVVAGALSWNYVGVLEIDLDRVVEGSSFPRVNLLYCIDATDWVVVEADSVEPTGAQGDRHLWHYAISWNDDWFGQGLEGWRVVEREAQDGQSC
jgi:hypothetical protein